REQTLNQLLVEMDGFESNEGVILVAATNRPDVLDPALLRPGRFDRRIVVNQAALNAARYNRKTVRMIDFEFAKDKVLMGSERRSMIISEAEKKITAVHEAGHALLAVLLPHADDLHKVTIIPRGMALGLTQQLPVDEKHNYSRDYLV